MTRLSFVSKLLAICTVQAVLVLTGAIPAAAGGQTRVNPQAEAIRGFSTRVGEYLALQKKLEGGLPALSTTTDTTRVDAHKELLANRLREARAGAKPGDLFGDAAPIVRQIVEGDSKSRSAGERRAAMQEVPERQRPAVGATYPERAPLATVPALLLKQLPRLPDGLEYRFMEQDLILRDTHANVIADVLPVALATKGR